MPRIAARQHAPLRLLLLLVALGVPLRADAQDQSAERCRPELTIRGEVRRLTVAPDGHVWLADTTGRTYHAADVTADFARGALSLAESADGFRINQISFVDDRIAIATGDMWTGVDQTSVYRTHDGGASWQVVAVGMPVETIESVHVGDGGNVWIGGTAGELRSSSDGGLTWRSLAAPFDPGATTNAIAMVSPTVGFVGAREGGRIRMTTDGGQSWDDVPPPAPATGRGVVERLGVVGSQLIAQVDGRVFHSDLRSISWQPFAEPRLVRFAVDGARRTMAGLTADRRLIVYDSRLTPDAQTGALPTLPIDLSIANGAVYAVDEHAGLYRVNGTAVTFAYPVTAENPSLRLQTVRSQRDRLVAVSERHVYTSSDGGERWCRIGHVASGIAGMAVHDDHRVLVWNGQGANVLFDLRDGSTSEAAPLAGYATAGVTEMSDGWLAHGRHDAASRRDGAAPAAGNGRAMPALNSALLLSRDRGATWTPVHDWPQAVIDRVALTPGGDVVLLGASGAVRRVPRAAGTPRAAGAGGKESGSGAAIERGTAPTMGHVTAFYFVSEFVGYIAGAVYPDGGRFFRTADGGRSWDAIAYDDLPFTAIFEVSGRHFGVKGSRILDRQGRAVPLTQAVVASLPGPEWTVSDISAAVDGMVLVELVRGDRDTAPVRNLRWLTVPLAPR